MYQARDSVPYYGSSRGAEMMAELVVWLSVWALGLYRDGYIIEYCARAGSKGLLLGSLRTWSRVTLDGS